MLKKKYSKRPYSSKQVAKSSHSSWKPGKYWSQRNNVPAGRPSYVYKDWFKVGGPFPESMMTYLPYSDNKAVSVTSGTPIVQVYRGNSPYDPDFTATGSSAAYWDTLVGNNNTHAPYHAYKCIDTEYEFELTNPNTSGSTQCRLAVTITPISGAYPAYIENAVMNPATQVTDIIDVAGSGNSSRKIHGKFRCADLLRDNSNNMSAAFYNGDPAFPIFIYVQVWVISEGVESITYYLTTKLKFHTLLQMKNTAILS